MPEKSTPLTDAWIARIATRLTRRGSRSAAARHAGISRQNLGKILRERGASRDSEVLLRLEEFAANQRPHASPSRKTPRPPRRSTRPDPAHEVSPEPAPAETLPSYLL